MTQPEQTGSSPRPGASGWDVHGWSPDRAETVEQAVFQAVGSASMCWESVSRAGVFDSSRAKQIADGLVVWLKRHGVADEVEKSTLKTRQAPLFTDVPLPFGGGTHDVG